MASSRWKRFAFFDRTTYNLPPHVIDDIIPRLTTDKKGTTSTSSSSTVDNSARRRVQLQPLPDDSILFPEENYSDDKSSTDRSKKGEYFSFIVTNAKLPKECLPSSSSSSDDVNDVNVSKGGVGIKGMLSTTAACTDPSLLTSNATKKDEIANISLKGQVSYKKEGKNIDVLFDNDKGVDLVLILASSRNTSRVHVVDVTVRANPYTKSINNSSKNNNSGNSARDEQDEDDDYGKADEDEDSIDLEDLDGWRGYYQPFAFGFPDELNTATPATAPATAPAEQRIIADHLASGAGTTDGPTKSQGRVVALASCYTTSSNNKTKSLHVASITDASSAVGIVVHIDPHLHLSSSLRTTSSSSSSSTSSINKRVPFTYYQPFAKFDFMHNGNPASVDIIPNIVAVGTDNGTVVLYSYNTTLSTTKKNKSTSGKNAGKLIFLVKIPPPKTLSSDTTSTTGHKKDNDASTVKAPYAVSSVKLVHTTTNTTTTTSKSGKKTMLFVTYRRRIHNLSSPISSPSRAATANTSPTKLSPATASSGSTGGGSTTGGGVCCYDLGIINVNSTSSSDSTSANLKASARYDLDGRDVLGSCLTDVVLKRHLSVIGGSAAGSNENKEGGGDGNGGYDGDHYMVARPDGLYTYSFTDKIGVSPIDGTKIAVCAVPPPPISRRILTPSSTSTPSQLYTSSTNAAGDTTTSGGGMSAPPSSLPVASVMDKAGASYSLVATTDSKSGRDAVDIYDATNKLVAFHVLLSPGHRALRAAGVTTYPTTVIDGSVRGGRSSALVFTSGGTIVTLTEKVTSDKVNLLVQKNLYSAAISMAFADPAYKPSDITALYRRHAEHLYRKGDFAGSMDQFIYTIGSLEPSHVIFRYLDAPKIPLLAKYLEELRSRDLATSVHNELLRTCYLKLNDTEAAEKIAAAASASMDASSCASIVSSLAHNPTEALATICSFEAPQAAESLVVHGATLARALPRETAGVVVSLCDGSYSPSALADAAAGSSSTSRRGVGVGDTPVIPEDSLQSGEERSDLCDRYPVHLFSSAFLENPKLLRLILAHCKKQKCFLSPSLQRTLLELTLEEWNNAKRTGDSEVEKMRRNEAIATLTDPNVEEIGDYEALVIVQGAGFTEGEVLLYEKLQMAPLLLEQYAKDGGERARRQMLAMCRSDPELLADVLGYFVIMAAEKIGLEGQVDNESVTSENDVEAILEDIRETLLMARDQGVLPPARITRILAGEGIGQFSSDQPAHLGGSGHSVPLSVALDYVGDILDASSKDISRLKADVEEYTQLCNSMEAEIKSLLSASTPQISAEDTQQSSLPHVNIEEMYANVRDTIEDSTVFESNSENVQEEFWRDMDHSEDRFDTIARYFGKGILK